MSTFSFYIKNLGESKIIVGTMNNHKVSLGEEIFEDIDLAISHYRKEILNKSSASDIDLDGLEFLVKLINRLLKIQYRKQKESFGYAIP